MASTQNDLETDAFHEVDVIKDGSCLFWSVALAYLLPVRHDQELFKRCDQLFGSTWIHSEIKMPDILQSFHDSGYSCKSDVFQQINHLVTQSFRSRVVDALLDEEIKDRISINTFIETNNTDVFRSGKFLAAYLEEFGECDVACLQTSELSPENIKAIEDVFDSLPEGFRKRADMLKVLMYKECMKERSSWGGDLELFAMSQLLRCNIQVFSDSNPLPSLFPCEGSSTSVHLILKGNSHYSFRLKIEPNTSTEWSSHELPSDLDRRVPSMTSSPSSDGQEVLPCLESSQQVLGAGQRVWKQESESTAVARKKPAEPKKTKVNKRLANKHSKQQCSRPDSKHTDGKRSYKKLPGCANTKGQNYEFKMAALLFLRGINSGRDFQLATNMAGAGALDDIVFRFLTHDQVWQTVFIQLKHKTSAQIRRAHLTELKGDFVLFKYFDSFQDVKQLACSDEQHEMFSGNFSEFHFVIFTNAELVSWKGDLETRDLSSPVGDYLKLNEVKASFTEDSVESIYSDLKKGEEKQTKKLKYPISSNKDDAKDFLRRLKLFTGQPSEDQLDDVIKAELEKFGENTEIDSVFRIFLERVKIWWEMSEGVILDQKSTILQEAQSEAIVDDLTKQQVKKFLLDVKFQDISTEEMVNACSGQHSCVNVVVEGDTRLTCTKLLQGLESRGVILSGTQWLRRDAEAVMTVWRSGKKNMLVIVSDGTQDDQNHEDICTKLLKVLQEVDSKRIVLVSSSNDPLARNLREIFGENFHQLQDTFNLTQLHQNTVKSIFAKKVTFQGHSTSLGAMISEDIDVGSHFLRNEILAYILSETNITVGLNLQDEIGYYIPRKLRLNFVMTNNVLSNIQPSSKVFIQNATKENMEKFLQTHGNSYIYNKFEESKNDLVFENSSSSITTVHYFDLIQNRLVWKRTEGDIRVLKMACVDESFTLILDGIQIPEYRVVLLIAEPGMGKSTFLTHLARETKQKHPESWVMFIALNDHTKLLANTDEENLNDEYLLSVILSLCTNSALEQNLFLYNLVHSRNVIIILDGFDEVAPKYINICTNIIKCILKTNVKQVLVSSRYCMKDYLEYHLSTLAVTLCKFTEDDQREFLVKYWSTFAELSIKDINDFSTKLIQLTAQSMNDTEKDFTGIPLQTLMLAEVYQDHITDKEYKLPEKIYITHLIEQFIDKKFVVYLGKLIVNKESAGYEILYENMRYFFDKNHKLAAILLLFDRSDCEILGSKNFIQKTEKFIRNVKSGIDKTGIVDRVIDEKPVFLHRVFAEYYAALWLADNYTEYTAYLQKNVISESFGVIRYMFDRCLARDHAIHKAVLSENFEEVSALLTTGVDVNLQDKGGRTPLHLAVITCLNRPWEQMIPMIQLLMKAKAHVDNTDDVLHWTSMQYADAGSLWAVMDVLLDDGYNSDISYLTRTKSSINDQNILEDIIKRDYANVVRLMLDFGLPVDSKLPDTDKNDKLAFKTLLHAAAEHNSPKVSQVLIDRCLKNKPDANQMSSLVETPSILELLDARDGWDYNPLIGACDKGHFSVVDLLLNVFTNDAEKADYVNIRTEDACALRCAVQCTVCSARNYDIVTLLLKSGACLTDRSSTGRTIFMSSACCKDVRILQLLLNAFPKELDLIRFVLLCDDNGWSALWHASRHGLHENVELLLKSGANIHEVCNISGGSVLMAAVQMSHMEVATVLLDSFSHNEIAKAYYVNRVDNYGNTAVSHAINRSPHGKDGYKIQRNIISKLIASGADVATQDNSGWTPLMQAVSSRSIEVISLLLDTLSDVNAKAEYVNMQDAQGKTAIQKLHNPEDPIVIAIEELLYRSGADVTTRDRFDMTPLMKYSKSGNVSVVKVILETFSDPTARSKYINETNICNMSAVSYVINYGFYETSGQREVLAELYRYGADLSADEYGITALMKYVGCGDVLIVNAILESFTDQKKKAEYVNMISKRGCSALSVAITRGQVEVVRVLMKTGADIHKVGRWTTALMLACDGSKVEIVKMLLDSFTDETDKAKYVNTPGWNGEPAIWNATMNTNHELTELLLGAGADITLRNRYEANVLMGNTYHSNVLPVVEVVKKLIDSLSDEKVKLDFINASDDHDRNPLWYAAHAGLQDIIKLLVTSGCDVTARDEDGNSALILVTERHRNCLEMVKVLVESINDASTKVMFVNYRNKESKSAFSFAAFALQSDVIDFLLASGAEIHDDELGCSTSLIAAVYRNDLACAKELFDNFPGVDKKEYINARDPKGRTALWLAVALERKYFVELLINEGADVTIKGFNGNNAILIVTSDNNIDIVNTLLTSFSFEEDKFEYINTVNDSGWWSAYRQAASDVSHIEIYNIFKNIKEAINPKE